MEMMGLIMRIMDYRITTRKKKSQRRSLREEEEVADEGEEGASQGVVREEAVEARVKDAADS